MTIRTLRVTKRVVAAVATAALGASLLALPSSPVGAAQTLNPTVRVSGADRYDTASVTAALVGCSSDIILVSGENQPDALGAAALAKKVNAPILLTPAASLSAAASNFIGKCVTSNGAQTVHILGGEAAVSADVAAAVDVLPSVSVNRIEGLNRYETAVAVATAVSGPSIGMFLGKRTAFLASGTSYVDALSAGPVSYRGVIGGTGSGPHPILLTAADALPASTDAALTSLGITQVIIMGGVGVVSDSVKVALEAKGITVIRIDGANRNATAVALAELATKTAGTGGFGFDGVNLGLANGTNTFGGFDALAAAPYLGKLGAPLVLTGSMPAETKVFIESKSTTLTTLRILGGTSAVSAETQTAAESAATLTTPTATITAEQGRSQFTVVLSEAVPVANVAAGDFSLNNAAFGGGPTVAAADATGTPSVATTFTVAALATPLAAGDSVRLNAAAVATADGRNVGTATAVVAADTVKPVATILVAANNASFKVSFSEPVTAVADGNFVSTDGQTPASALTVTGSSLDATNMIATVTVSRNLLPGDKVGILGSVIADLATPANNAVATLKTVVADNVAPALNGATLKVEDTATASRIFDGAGGVDGAAATGTAVKYTSKMLGSSGNTTTVQYTNVGATGTEVVSVSGTAITVRTRTGGSTPAQVAAAVNANITSSPLVTAAAIFETSTDKIDVVQLPTLLNGGATKATVVATFSEVVILGVNYQIWSGQSGISTNLGAGVVTEADGTSATYTITITNPTVRPGASAEFVVTAGGTDLSTNPLPVKKVTITAAA